MRSLIQGPLLRPELPGQRVADLKEVHGIEAGPQPLVALVVGHRMAQLRPHPTVVVPVEGLPHENEVGLQPVDKGPQLLQILRRQAIGHVQPQAVNAELVHPGANGLELVVHHRRVPQIQLDQLVVALPGLVPEAVVPVGVTVEADVEPVLVGAVPLFLPNVPEGPEAPAHMVEHPVQHHPQARVVEGFTHPGQVLVGPQPGVHLEIIAGIIAVAVTVEHRVQQHRVRSRLFDMVHPVQQLQDTVVLYFVVVPGRAAQAQGIDLINHRLVKPHMTSPSAPPRLWRGTTLYIIKYHVFHMWAGKARPRNNFAIS